MTMSEKLPVDSPLRALRAIAAAVGLDPDTHRIRSIDIHADTDRFATVAVTLLVDTGVPGRLAEVVRRYDLQERETTEMTL